MERKWERGTCPKLHHRECPPNPYHRPTHSPAPSHGWPPPARHDSGSVGVLGLLMERSRLSPEPLDPDVFMVQSQLNPRQSQPSFLDSIPPALRMTALCSLPSSSSPKDVTEDSKATMHWASASLRTLSLLCQTPFLSVSEQISRSGLNFEHRAHLSLSRFVNYSWFPEQSFTTVCKPALSPSS